MSCHIEKNTMYQNSQKKLIFSMIFGIHMVLCFAQNQIVISGIIYDKDSTLIPATIMIKGYLIGAVSDVNGKYNITIPDSLDSFILQYSFVGYQNKEVLLIRDSIDTKNITIKGTKLGSNSTLIYAQEKNIYSDSIYTINDTLKLDIYLEQELVNNVISGCFGGTLKKTIYASTLSIKTENIVIQIYVNEYLKYPKSALKNRTEGTVQIQFSVDEKCVARNVVVLKGISKDCDKEAIRLLKSNPENILINDNIKVNTVYKSYIYFKLP